VFALNVRYKCSSFNSYRPFRTIAEIVLKLLNVDTTKPHSRGANSPLAHEHGGHGGSSAGESESPFSDEAFVQSLQSKIEAAYRCVLGMRVSSSDRLERVATALQDLEANFPSTSDNDSSCSPTTSASSSPRVVHDRVGTPLSFLRVDSDHSLNVPTPRARMRAPRTSSPLSGLRGDSVPEIGELHMQRHTTTPSMAATPSLRDVLSGLPSTKSFLVDDASNFGLRVDTQLPRSRTSTHRRALSGSSMPASKLEAARHALNERHRSLQATILNNFSATEAVEVSVLLHKCLGGGEGSEVEGSTEQAQGGAGSHKAPRYSNSLPFVDESFAHLRILKLCMCLLLVHRPNFLLLVDDICDMDYQSWNVFVEFMDIIGMHSFDVLVVATSRLFGEVSDPYLEQVAYAPNRNALSKMDHVFIRTLPDFEPAHMQELVRHFLQIQSSSLPASMYSFLMKTYEGNPLYAIQLAKLLKNKGVVVVDHGTCTVNAGRLESVAREIPTGIKGMMSAKFDNLPADLQTIVRVASVFGEQPFDIKLLSRVLSVHNRKRRTSSATDSSTAQKVADLAALTTSMTNFTSGKPSPGSKSAQNLVGATSPRSASISSNRSASISSPRSGPISRDISISGTDVEFVTESGSDDEEVEGVLHALDKPSLSRYRRRTSSECDDESSTWGSVTESPMDPQESAACIQRVWRKRSSSFSQSCDASDDLERPSPARGSDMTPSLSSSSSPTRRRRSGQRSSSPRKGDKVTESTFLLKLAAKLDRLVGQNLLIVRGVGAAKRYSFRNSMIRKAAYDMLLSKQKKPLHKAIAEGIEHNIFHQISSLRRSGNYQASRMAAGEFQDEDFVLDPTYRDKSELGISSVLTSFIREYRLLAQHLHRAGSLERSLYQGLRAVNLASNMHNDESVIAIATEVLGTLDMLQQRHQGPGISFEIFVT